MELNMTVEQAILLESNLQDLLADKLDVEKVYISFNLRGHLKFNIYDCGTDLFYFTLDENFKKIKWVSFEGEYSFMMGYIIKTIKIINKKENLNRFELLRLSYEKKGELKK